MLHCLFDKVTMFLIAKQDDITIRAGNINSRIDSRTIGLDDFEVHHNDATVPRFKSFYELFQISAD